MVRSLSCALLICALFGARIGLARAQSQPPAVLFAIEAHNLRLNRTLLSGLDDYLAAALTERGWRVIAAGEMRSAKPVQARLPCADHACRAEVTRQMGSDHYLVPALLKVGSKCTVVLQSFSAAAPGAERAATAHCACAEDALLAGLDLAVAKVAAPAPAVAQEAGTQVVRQPEELAVDMGEGRSERPAAPAPMAEVKGETGRLSLNSVPWGRVWIDGRDTGLVTPVMDTPLPVGRRQVEVRTVDGEVLSAEVEIWADESSSLILRSNQGGAADGNEAGWLSVNTRPWSEVTVDGRHVGMTPLRHRLLPGTHQVRLGFAHGEVKTEEVRIQPGRTARLVAEASTPPTFQFKPGMGLLKLHSSPWGRVWINGKDSGKATPVFDMQLPAGTHRLTIHFSTGGFMSDEVVIRAGETTRKIIRER